MKKLLRPVRFLTNRSLILFAWAFTPALFFLIVVAVLASINDIDFYMLSVEPMEIFKAEPYIGLLSNVGIIVMSASSAILLYSSFVSRRQDGLNRNASFLLWVGLFTFVLLVDDLFMFHEKVLPAVFGTYLVEPMLYGLYALSALLVLYFYYDLILDTYFVVFLAALIFYGMFIKNLRVIMGDTSQHKSQDTNIPMSGNITQFMLFGLAVTACFYIPDFLMDLFSSVAGYDQQFSFSLLNMK